MSINYKELLERVYTQLSSEVFEHKRFEIPRVRSATIGMKTIIINYEAITASLNRDPLHLLRYLSREMATAGAINGERAIFQGKFRNDTLNRLIRYYAEQFVICPICKRPDTRIVKEKRFSFLSCDACGAKSSIKNI